MSDTTKKSLSPTEWKLMKILWNNSPMAARDVHKIAEERYGMTKGFTKNLLFRLVEKGHIETQQIGNCYLYHPVSPMVDSVCEAADELFEHTSKEVADTFMLNLVKKGKLSEQGIQKIRQLLDEYKE